MRNVMGEALYCINGHADPQLTNEFGCQPWCDPADFVTAGELRSLGLIGE